MVPVGVHLLTRTDIVISKGNLVYCVIETKKYPLLPKYNGNPLDGIRSLFSDQEEHNETAHMRDALFQD